MKNQLIIISLILFQVISLSSFGQTVYTKSDTIQLEQDSVILNIDEYRGQIQWQYSKGSLNWEDIEGATADTLFIQDIDSSGFYRAKIIDANCDPIYSDSTYVLRDLSEEDKSQMIVEAGSMNDEVVFYAPDSSNTIITVIDTTGNNNMINIQTTVDLDSIKPGWLLVDTTGIGQIIFVTNYVEEKRGADVIKKFIDGVQVGIDFLMYDDTLSYSSPTNRTKDWWDNPMKLTNDGKVKKVEFESYLQGMEETVEKEYLQLDFSGTQLWNVEGDNSHLNITIEEGYLKYNPAIDFYSIYNPGAIATAALGSVISLPTVLEKSDYIVKGMLDNLKIITYNDFDFRLKLNIDGSFDNSLDIKPKTIAHFWYSIPAGPVIISIKTDLIARMTFEASGDINIQPDYELQKNLVLGVDVVKENEAFNKEFIYDHHEEKSSSTSYDGNFNFHERFEIVPSVEIYVYGLLGIDGELIPYQEFDFNASISDEHPLIFDCNMDIGVDGHASFDISAFHFDTATKELFKKNWEISAKKNLYHAPSKLSYYSGTGQTGKANTALSNSLMTKVYDSNNKPINNFPVFYDVTSGGGSLSYNTPITNSLGIAMTNWTLGSSGEQKVKAKLTKADITQAIGEVEFTATIDNTPSLTVETNPATNITQTSAQLNGQIISDGGLPLTYKGFNWYAENDSGYVESSSTTNDLVYTLTGLTPGTTYHFEAYANNGEEYDYGDRLSFTTETSSSQTGEFTDSRDGNTYKWVKIGEQIWMAENLAYLPQVNPSSNVSTTESYYYVYGYNGAIVDEAKTKQNFITFGVLYNWPAALEACPNGWHLPTDDEWKELEMEIGLSQSEADGFNFRGTDQGTKLKTTYGWQDNGNGTDDYGFSGLPGGVSYNDGHFYYIGYYNFWWSATEIDTSPLWRHLASTRQSISRAKTYKANGFSVRCVKD